MEQKQQQQPSQRQSQRPSQSQPDQVYEARSGMFRSHDNRRPDGSPATYRVRLTPDGTVHFDYDDGVSIEVFGLAPRYIQQLADRGVWKRVGDGTHAPEED